MKIACDFQCRRCVLNNKVSIGLLFLLMLQSYQAWSFAEPCQLVAQMAGDKGEYKQQPLRIASMTTPNKMPIKWSLSLIENHGAWYVYQTPTTWFNKESCAPIKRSIATDNTLIEFMPVLLNTRTGHNAVITGTFIIKTYRKSDLKKVMQHYHFKGLSPLPNPQSMIVDVKPTDSYDLLIETLDRDNDVILALPLLSEPR